MANKPTGDQPMKLINLYTDTETLEQASYEAKKRRVSRSQVLREWMQLGKEASVDRRLK